MSGYLKGQEKPQMSAGFAFIFKQRGLTLLMCFFAIFNFLMNVASSLTEPLALSISGSVALGMVQMAAGIGIFLGSIYVTKHDIKLTYSFAIFCSACVAGLALIITGAENHIVFMLMPKFLKSENGLAILLGNSLGKGNLNYRCMYLLSGTIAIVCALIFFSRSSMKELGKEE